MGIAELELAIPQFPAFFSSPVKPIHACTLLLTLQSKTPTRHDPYIGLPPLGRGVQVKATPLPRYHFYKVQPPLLCGKKPQREGKTRRLFIGARSVQNLGHIFSRSSPFLLSLPISPVIAIGRHFEKVVAYFSSPRAASLFVVICFGGGGGGVGSYTKRQMAAILCGVSFLVQAVGTRALNFFSETL